ncbi:hypothetical protein KKF84_02685 [Myxococcota bacterium]|nr:hypothetical protein [Myxococcota bacterium]MBU1534196.1 hypothetical protein [Myxococcota bacterium]
MAKKKAGPDALHGISLNLDLGSTHRLNIEPDNASWITSYSVGAGYALGRQLAPKSWFKGLTLSAAFSFSNEVMGNDPSYRSSYFSDPNFYSKDLSYLAFSDTVLSEQEASNIDRRVDGAQRRIDYSDIVMTLAHGSIATIPVAKIGVSGSISAAIPLSLASTNAGLVTKFDYSLGLGRSFKFGGMSLGLSYGFTFSHYIYEYATKGIDPIGDSVLVNGQAYDTLTYNSGSRNNEFGFTNMLGVSLSPMKKLTVSAVYGILTLRSYQFTNCNYTTPDGTVIDLCQTTTSVRGYDDGGRGRRDFQMFSLGVSYKLLDYLSLSATLSTFTPQLKATTDEYQQPFLSFDRNNYSSVMFKVSYSFDSFYKKMFVK